MIYSDFQELKLSRLGFGAMRLPLIKGGGDGDIDQSTVNKMVRYAMEHGVNYYDTAYPYHLSRSELSLGEALSPFPRDSYYIATKFPGHQIAESYEPAVVFEDQLKKCRVDYFDFYLLHNVNEGSIGNYLDERWGIIDYFVEQKRLGRIKHLGFSAHGAPECIERFLDICGEHMEFCQIQLNYLDWSLQDAKRKYELLTERGIPVWVMEPVHGGKLCAFDEKIEAGLRALRPNESIASWGFRWLQRLPNVKMILSGMSNLEQAADNVKTFSGGEPLSDSEAEKLLEIAEGLKSSVPCTACRYCCKGCPMQLDIPMLISICNNLRFAHSLNDIIRVEGLPEDRKPTACIGCGQCTQICPQNINVPEVMAELSQRIAKSQTWAEASRLREEAQLRERLI